MYLKMGELLSKATTKNYLIQMVCMQNYMASTKPVSFLLFYFIPIVSVYAQDLSSYSHLGNNSKNFTPALNVKQ